MSDSKLDLYHPLFKERPILFNAEMVRAILDGRKTQTRRVIKPQPIGQLKWHKDIELWSDVITGNVFKDKYGRMGDALWVRETTWINGGYVATDEPNFPNEGKRPSIFMPRLISRITLEITNVRVERVQDISHEDALLEGIDPNAPYNDYGTGSIYRDTFAELWDYINKKRGYSWQSNPYVWVIEFKRLKPD